MNNQFSGRIENPQVIEQLIADKNSNKLFVFGANWCPDAMNLLQKLNETSTKKILDNQFIIYFIDVEKYSINMEIYKSFGMDAIEGIPRVFLVSKSGKVLNLETNDHWRNSRNIPDKEFVKYLQSFSSEL
jgi:thiol-disulfide isomerase/thioredoxin